MRKWICGALLLVMCMECAGCASVQKKFTRKKKEPAHVPAVIYFDETPYQKKYSNSYTYKTHYMFWRSWHSDLLDQLGGNRKKIARSAQEAYGHLDQMQKLLLPEKRSFLQPELDSFKVILDRINSNNYSESEEGGMRAELEKIRRLVSNDFYFDKIKDQILSDKIDLGPSPEVTQDAGKQTPGG